MLDDDGHGGGSSDDAGPGQRDAEAGERGLAQSAPELTLIGVGRVPAPVSLVRSLPDRGA